jgi:hypothetical protein
MNNYVALFSQMYYDPYSQTYKMIITSKTLLEGPIRPFMQRIQIQKVSQFESVSAPKPCVYSFKNVSGLSDDIMTIDDFTDLYTYLLSNGYDINTSLNELAYTYSSSSTIKMTNPCICLVRYPK